MRLSHSIFKGEWLKPKLRQGYMPALNVRLDGDINELIINYSGQYYSLCYGYFSRKIEDLSRILGIKAIVI